MSDRKYAAAALENGLDILDRLAGHGRAMSLSQISVALGKSANRTERRPTGLKS
jgi:DNA-binding IclR family transcriptional regulator